MKQLFLIVALVFGLTSAGLAQKARAGSNENETEKIILALEAENNRAVVAGDGAALEKLYADDFSGVNAAGGFSTKAQIVDFYSSGGAIIAINSSDQTKVRVFDKTAVVTARLKYKYNEKMEDQSVDWLRYTRIYNLRGKNWVVVAEHYSFIEGLNSVDSGQTAQY